MLIPILKTKLFIPASESKTILRQPLIKKLQEGLEYKLTLISAPEGFGKRHLFVIGSQWLSLNNMNIDT